MMRSPRKSAPAITTTDDVCPARTPQHTKALKGLTTDEIQALDAERSMKELRERRAMYVRAMQRAKVELRELRAKDVMQTCHVAEESGLQSPSSEVMKDASQCQPARKDKQTSQQNATMVIQTVPITRVQSSAEGGGRTLPRAGSTGAPSGVAGKRSPRGSQTSFAKSSGSLCLAERSRR